MPYSVFKHRSLIIQGLQKESNMPYISSEEVAAIRKAIRAALPEYSISVTKQHHSTVQVSIMSGPIAPVEHVNVYWYKENLEDRPDAVAVIDAILAEIRKVKQPRALSYQRTERIIP